MVYCWPSGFLLAGLGLGPVGWAMDSVGFVQSWVGIWICLLMSWNKPRKKRRASKNTNKATNRERTNKVLLGMVTLRM